MAGPTTNPHPHRSTLRLGGKRSPLSTSTVGFTERSEKVDATLTEILSRTDLYQTEDLWYIGLATVCTFVSAGGTLAIASLMGSVFDILLLQEGQVTDLFKLWEVSVV